ncbi:hypothetical protein Acr_20g0010480 [Actinidia rufa]|uniref:Uncharacterized protein n=1 Tax=Actinidia rufa TaxID=165716 RepID=A0A7J0GEK1_9ERIC|nr:hypothetical protein Acr_20g0010480 [Actinidia rufa]
MVVFSSHRGKEEDSLQRSSKNRLQKGGGRAMLRFFELLVLEDGKKGVLPIAYMEKGDEWGSFANILCWGGWLSEEGRYDQGGVLMLISYFFPLMLLGRRVVVEKDLPELLNSKNWLIGTRRCSWGEEQWTIQRRCGFASLGLPLHLSDLAIFRATNDSCGGYVGIEEPTATRSYLWRVRVCVHGHNRQTPSSF